MFCDRLGGVYTSEEIPESLGEAKRSDGTRRRGNGGGKAKAAEPADNTAVEFAMSQFNALPDEGRVKVEERWTKVVESWAGKEKPGSIDDGALFEVPAAWSEGIMATIEKAIQHYEVEPFPVASDDEIVDAEIVDDGEETE